MGGVNIYNAAANPAGHTRIPETGALNKSWEHRELSAQFDGLSAGDNSQMPDDYSQVSSPHDTTPAGWARGHGRRTDDKRDKGDAQRRAVSTIIESVIGCPFDSEEGLWSGPFGRRIGVEETARWIASDAHSMQYDKQDMHRELTAAVNDLYGTGEIYGTNNALAARIDDIFRRNDEEIKRITGNKDWGLQFSTTSDNAFGWNKDADGELASFHDFRCRAQAVNAAMARMHAELLELNRDHPELFKQIEINKLEDLRKSMDKIRYFSEQETDELAAHYIYAPKYTRECIDDCKRRMNQSIDDAISQIRDHPGALTPDEIMDIHEKIAKEWGDDIEDVSCKQDISYRGSSMERYQISTYALGGLSGEYDRCAWMGRLLNRSKVFDGAENVRPEDFEEQQRTMEILGDIATHFSL